MTQASSIGWQPSIGKSGVAPTLTTRSRTEILVTAGEAKVVSGRSDAGEGFEQRGNLPRSEVPAAAARG